MKHTGNSKNKIVYVRRKFASGQPAVSDVRLPNGTTIRRVDEKVHQRALEAVNKRYLEQTDG